MNLAEYKGVYVFAQQVDNQISSIALELIGKGKDLAKDLGTTVTAVLVGSNIKGLADELGEYGADKVIVVDDPELKDYRTEPYTHAITSVINEFKPDIFLIGATAIGRDLGPRVCARIHTGLTADCTQLDIGDFPLVAMPGKEQKHGQLLRASRVVWLAASTMVRCYGMVTGQSWVLVPESVKFNLIGELPEGVYARDLILTIIGQVGANGCNYQVMEFTGEGAKTLSISDRIALCNMAVEAGAKTGIFEADEKAMEYLKEHGREPKAVFHSDPDAHYIREYTIDLSKVEPVVAKPDFVDNLSPAKEVRGIKIDEAFLGSCNNGRIEDLRVGAEVIKGKKVADKVRFLVVPASQTIYRQALKEGLLDIFMEAGAIVMNPNCSVCWGSCQGVIGENEVLISTGTRNFKGRAGHPSSKVYLGSAATVTASAIKGEIALASDL